MLKSEIGMDLMDQEDQDQMVMGEIIYCITAFLKIKVSTSLLSTDKWSNHGLI